MGFDEVRFPTDIAYGATGGPAFLTDIVETAGGYEQRNVQWGKARALYNVAHGVKTQEQLDALVAFFRARKGRARGFRFKDWSDYQAEGQLLALGDGASKVFQLVKRYESGGVSEVRIITKPILGTVRIRVGESQLEAGVEVDLAKGTVTLAEAPAVSMPVVADFEFDVPVRFDTDHLAVRLENYGVFSWADIPLVEIRQMEAQL